MFQGLFIDGFAGGGGASTGIAQAIGREVDIAVNHSETAIAIHKANHPGTEHFCQDIKAIWPLAATKMQPVAGAWFSPDCKEFSKAKGGPVKDRSIRALCWEVVAWLKDVRPTCGYLENVEEFEYAAPLDEEGNPIKGQEGREFKRFVKAIRALGYKVDWKILRACDYGAPTSRKRLYMIMRCDGLKIVWPKPTHGRPDSPGVKRGKLLPYRTAAEIIDWGIEAPSIFDRKKDLAEASNRRIAHGVMRYVVNAMKPYVVRENGIVVPHLMTNRNSQKPFNGANEPTHTITAGGAHLNVVQAALVSYGQHGGHNRPVDEPHHTVAASKKDTNGVVAATLVQTGYGERPGQQPRVPHLDKPIGTMVAGGAKHAAVTAFLSAYYGSGKTNGGGEPERPLRTARAGGTHHAVVTAHIEQANGGPRNTRSAGRAADRPLSTATASGSQQRIVQTTLIEEDALPPEMMDRAVKVAAFLVKYYATDGENETSQIQPVDRPLDTITTKARFAVVTVTIDAITYVIVDIGLRMLTPRELARAQGFPDSYVLDPECWYTTEKGNRKFGRLPKAMQISAIGNSVCPPVARALVAANQPGLAEMRMAA
ncbi:DNA cytosine methyltransferase [Sphingobium indicum]|uniref:DNA (cytosine-5-)-methyltransferase n=1 Tax=Sphingobium indicum (strain DSM 16412 / CCM 7286 / MTCC 6364 / B90A) TaxID=861109 RepID=A0A1L5BME5_SPHIB|nr:DNA cytosine methyltransferase [Sphingobium indicum]APL94071.1 C-5 cytosine-specific DNA methylase [Sphingobium indicum B90A]